MAQEFVVAALGPDRLGIVADFTADVYAAGANLSKTRMVNLGGHFAFVALVEGPDSVVEGLKSQLREAAPRRGLTFEFSGLPSASAGEGVLYRLKTYSLDQRGIVKEFSTFLHFQGINIEDLETEMEASIGDGQRIFIMKIIMLVPSATNINTLRHALEALGNQLGCNVDLDRVL